MLPSPCHPGNQHLSTTTLTAADAACYAPPSVSLTCSHCFSITKPPFLIPAKLKHSQLSIQSFHYAVFIRSRFTVGQWMLHQSQLVTPSVHTGSIVKHLSMSRHLYHVCGIVQCCCLLVYDGVAAIDWTTGMVADLQVLSTIIHVTNQRPCEVIGSERICLAVCLVVQQLTPAATTALFILCLPMTTIYQNFNFLRNHQHS